MMEDVNEEDPKVEEEKEKQYKKKEEEEFLNKGLEPIKSVKPEKQGFSPILIKKGSKKKINK